MKTLLVSEIFPPKTGGSGRWFWEIYRRLPSDQYVLAVGEDPRQAEFDAANPLTTVRLPLRMPEWGVLSWQGARGYWKNVRRLRGLGRQFGISRVHCGRCLPEGVMALGLKKWTGIPYVCYVHGEDVNTARQSREHAMLVRQVLRGAECCIANSANTAGLLSADWGLPDRAVRILHPGVDTKQFLPAARNDAVRQQLGWSERSVVLTVGRLQRRKGQDMMIRALPRIAAAIDNVLYAIVGDGEDRKYLQQLAAEHGVTDRVQFRNETTDSELVQCYQQCDLFALPNREVDGDIEGFGMVLLEAQACGRPVLAGDSGGTAETMDVGRTGCIVNCTAPEALAEQTIALLANAARCQAMGAAGRAWVVARFDWDALAREAHALFLAGEGINNGRQGAL